MINADAIEGLKTLDSDHFQTCVTSPPYWGLRDYGVAGQLGAEETPEEYVANIVAVFDEVKRVLRPDGTLWLNLGDSYAGSGKGRRLDGSHQEANSKQASSKGSVAGRLYRSTPQGYKPKDLIGIPWMIAFALRSAGWHLRQDIIWHKPNPMPESVLDRCTRSHEYIFLLSKSARYYFNSEAIKEPAVDKKGCGNTRQPRQVPGHAEGTIRHNLHKIPVRDLRNRRSVWRVPTTGYKGAHFAVYPPRLIEPCILAGSKPQDFVLDPFMGSGTTGVVCKKNQRAFVGIELNKEYFELGRKRIDEAPWA